MGYSYISGRTLFSRLRNSIIYIVVKFAAGAWNAISSAYNVFFNKKQYELTITPQVWALEKILNDTYDSSLRRINIDEPIPIEINYFYEQAQERDWYFVAGVYFAGSDTGYLYDFYVNIPSQLSGVVDQINATVKKFKLPSKSFKIIMQ